MSFIRSTTVRCATLKTVPDYSSENYCNHQLKSKSGTCATMSGLSVALLSVISFAVCSCGVLDGNPRGNDQSHNDFVGYFTSAIFDQIAREIPNEQCRRHLRQQREHANNFTLWAVQMLDASSKPSGILGGAIYHLGHYDECLAVDNGESGSDRITGKYCIATVKVIPRIKQDSRCSENDPRACSAWNKLQPPSNRMKLQRNLIRVAMCIPSSCTGHDLQIGLQFLEKKYRAVSIQTTIEENMCQVENLKSEKWLTLFWCSVILYTAFLLTYDRLLQKSEKDCSSSTVWSRAFSVRSHWKQLTDRESKERSKDSISCIHGMRVFSMVIIVMGHRAEAITAGPLINGDAIEEMYEDFLSILAMNGHLIVDVFFTISGFLICWNLLRSLEMGKKINIMSLYLNRYLRLTPALMLVMAFEAFVLFDLSSGPLWNYKVGAERDNCRKNWWTNLLYVNNYVHPERPCIDPSWYLACDMQMYLVAPFIVLGLHKWKKNGHLLLKLAISIAIIVPFVITYVGDLDPTIIPDPSTLGHSVENYTYVSTYVTAYCRAGPYLVGMAFAYWLHTIKMKSEKISKGILWSGWIFGPLAQFTMLAAAVVFYQPDHQLSKFSVALYSALHRTVFSVGVGFCITACAAGQGGIINRLLSWDRLRPFSQLTYSVFLCHTVVQMYHFASVRTPMFMSYTDTVWLSISDLVISVIFAAILYLTVERPVIVLATAILEMGKSTQSQEKIKRVPTRPAESEKAKSSIGSVESLDIVGLALGQIVHLEWDHKKRG